MMNRVELFEKALAMSKEALSKAPYMFPLESVVEQIQYLLDLEVGRTMDREKLKTIDLGLIAARDIETFDSSLSDLLHDVSAQAREMSSKPRLRGVK